MKLGFKKKGENKEETNPGTNWVVKPHQIFRRKVKGRELKKEPKTKAPAELGLVQKWGGVGKVSTWEKPPKTQKICVIEA